LQKFGSNQSGRTSSPTPTVGTFLSVPALIVAPHAFPFLRGHELEETIKIERPPSFHPKRIVFRYLCGTSRHRDVFRTDGEIKPATILATILATEKAAGNETASYLQALHAKRAMEGD
jgi:hypothetical protein